MAFPSFSSCSSSHHVKSFHVFPSFHGPDVRRGFLSHLHNLFARKGITMFKDQEIERGRTIGPELVKAIRGSMISIVLLSKSYASSRWCLDELVEILKCREDQEQIVMPIFYYVDPSHVRRQRGDFGMAFEKTCEGQTEEKKRRWMEALTCVANIEGEYFHNWTDEAAMVEKVSTDVSNKVKVEEMKEEFRSFDIDQNGFITEPELRYAMTIRGKKVTDEQVRNLIRAADVDGDGRISYDEFLNLMAKIDEPETKDTDSEEKLKKFFMALDVDGDGLVSAAELRYVMTNLGKKVTDEEVSNIMRAADVDGDGRISYDEFVKVVAKIDEPEIKDTDSEEKLKKFFMALDVDRNGFISAAELRYVMTIQGKNVTDEQVRNLFRAADVDGDGWISYDEFVKLMAKSKTDKAPMVEKFATYVSRKLNVTMSREEEEELKEAFSHNCSRVSTYDDKSWEEPVWF